MDRAVEIGVIPTEIEESVFARGSIFGCAARPSIAPRARLGQIHPDMPYSDILLYVYGVLLIFGGVMGYVKAHSTPSLVAGVVCGIIAIILGYRYTWHYAPYAALLLALFLIFIMGRRYLRTRKPMPALLIVVLSLIVAVVQVYNLVTIGAGHEPL